MSVAGLRRIVIVGGGLAAVRAAERLAERGFRGHVDLVAGEPHVPYRRPALSDGVLTGRVAPRQLAIRARMPERARWVHGVRAVGLDRSARRVALSNGRELPYDGLIVATGLRARTLPAFDAVDPGLVHTLRTIDDALRFRRAARRARHVLVVGGGLVGTEAAWSLVSQGIGVTVLDPMPTLLHAVAGPRVGASLTELHRSRGVHVLTQTGVAGAEWGTRGVVANLTNGNVLRADAALVAIGAVPEVDWLVGSGLDVERGVSCEPTLHAVGADDIVAAGDCARWPNLRFGGASGRVEQWVTTQLMAQHAADSLLAGRDAATAFTPIPWGWTEQWGVRMHLVGAPAPHAEHRVIDGDPDALRGAFALHDELGRMIAGVSAERPGATLRLMDELALAWPEPPADAAARWREAVVAPLPTPPAGEHHGARTETVPLLRRFARSAARADLREGVVRARRGRPAAAAEASDLPLRDDARVAETPT